MNKLTLLYEVAIPMANRPFKKEHNTITSLILTNYLRTTSEGFYDNYIAIKEMLEKQDDTLIVMMINKQELHVVFNSSKEDEFSIHSQRGPSCKVTRLFGHRIYRNSEFFSSVIS